MSNTPVRIVSLGKAVPKTVITNDDLTKILSHHYFFVTRQDKTQISDDKRILSNHRDIVQMENALRRPPLCIDMNVFLSTKNRRKAVLRRLSKKKIPVSVITDYGSAISNGEAGNPALL